ncbi:MAG: GIY-YIG nuclease family protein [Flavobacteriia bacterium]|nr:GIY-YIG nuclease family protein [Flavobacteriia bacterium]
MFAVIDVETTGGSPKNSKITEIAIYKTDGQKIIDQYETLINPEQKIPEFIIKLTGISNELVKNAPKFFEVAKNIIDFTKECVFVAHNVSFDYSMLRNEFKSLGFDFRLPHLCTVRTGKFLLPGHPSYSLGKLSHSLGIELKNRHRAAGDALATTLIFHKIFEKGLSNVEKFIQKEINPKSLHPKFDLEFYDEIPNKTGVYKLFNENNRLIYIGKSKHIKKRLDQHLKNTTSKKGITMRSEIARVEFELTGSELIALLLESSLIKQFQPLYNRKLRRSMFPVGLYSSYNEKGYIELYIEKSKNQNDVAICLFSNTIDAKKYLENVIKTYVLCSKLCQLEKSPTSCFMYGLKQCFGACIEKESAEKYNLRVLQFIERQKWEHTNMYILEKGIHKNEKSILLIENGQYNGFGWIPIYALRKEKTYWKNFITAQKEDNDAREIIHSYMRKNKELQLVPF